MRQSVPKFLALLAVVAAACGEPTGTQSGISPARGSSNIITASTGTITKVAGDGLIAQTGVAVAINPTIRLLDLSGNPIANEPITFTSSNGSTMFSSATTYTVNTNAQGYAATIWTLGTVGGQTLRAGSGSSGISTTFDAISTTTGAAPTIQELQGEADGTNNQTMAGRIVPLTPTVIVMDPDGTTKLDRVSLFWTPSGNGAVTNVVTTTPASGIATADWRFSTTAGVQTLTVNTTARFNSAGTKIVTAASFSRTALGNGAALTALTGDGRTYTALTTPGSAFGTKNMAVKLTDANGAAVVGVPVTVTFGTGVNNCGDTNTDIFYTNAVGVVQLRTCNTSATTGTRTVTFTAADLSVAVTGTVGVGAGNNYVQIQGLPADGTPATGTVGTLVTANDPTVRLRDAANVAVPNVAVTITASGNGSVANMNATGAKSGNSITVNTDANGLVAARWTRGTVSGAQTLTFTLVSDPTKTSVFNQTATPAAAAKIVRLQAEVLTYNGAGGTTKNPAVSVTDQYDNKITTAVAATWTASGPAASTFICGNVNTGACYGGQPVDRSEAAWTLGATSGTYTATVAVSGATSVSFTVVRP